MKAILVKRKTDWAYQLVTYCPNWLSWLFVFWYKYIKLYDMVEARKVS